MKADGLTAAELAERSGLTEAAISLLRAGRRSPTLDSARRLSSVLPALAERLRSDMDAASPFDSIESAIADIRSGKMIVVLDDEDRENEGDLVMAAQLVSAEAINFMRKEGGGLICVPMLGERLDELHIPPMVRENSSLHETAFSVSVEARGRTTTGISAQDRAATIQALLDPSSRARQISCAPVIPFRCAPATAACSCGSDKPKPRSILRDLRISIRPASSARSWTTTER